MPFVYKEIKMDVGYRIDLLVEHKVSQFKPDQVNVFIEQVVYFRFMAIIRHCDFIYRLALILLIR
jgi:hypothetical protein